MSGNRIIDVNGNVYANAFSALGNVSANGNIYANTGSIIALSLSGDGGNITNILGNNITGPVANAVYASSAGTVTANAQPNITSVGILSALSVTGNVGIGTTSPGVPLQVEGSIRFASNGVGSNYLEFARTAQNQWKLGSNGVGDVFTIVGNAVTFPQNVIVKRGGLEVSPSLDNNTSAINIIQTWNNASTTFSLIKANVADTASNAASLLMDLQVGGTSRFNVTKEGSTTISGSTHYTNILNNTITIRNNGTGFRTELIHSGNESFYIKPYGWSVLMVSAVDFTPSVQILANKSFGWSSSTSLQTQGDLTLYRDAADTFAQRRGVNAQAFNLYNTYTDASNYERGIFKWNSNVLTIGTETTGTGISRNINIVPATNVIEFGSSTNTTVTLQTPNVSNYNLKIKPRGTNSSITLESPIYQTFEITDNITNGALDFKIEGSKVRVSRYGITFGKELSSNVVKLAGAAGDFSNDYGKNVQFYTGGAVGSNPIIDLKGGDFIFGLGRGHGTGLLPKFVFNTRLGSSRGTDHAEYTLLELQEKTVKITGDVTCANVTVSSYHIRSVNGSVAAAGTIQADATALTKEINVVSTVNVGSGVILPSAVAGMVIIVNNISANALNVYPAIGASINGGAANTAYTHAAGSSLQYYSVSDTQWYTT